MKDTCLNCGLKGVGDNDPWKHTNRFEMDEDICKQCGASYETSSENYLTEKLAKAHKAQETAYDHHAEHAKSEVHAIQARENTI